METLKEELAKMKDETKKILDDMLLDSGYLDALIDVVNLMEQELTSKQVLKILNLKRKK